MKKKLEEEYATLSKDMQKLIRNLWKIMIRINKSHILNFEVDIQHPENLHKTQNNLPFLPGRMKVEKVRTLVANLHDKTEYVIST